MSSVRGAPPPQRQKRVSFKEGWEEICIDYNHFSHYHFSDPDCVPLVLQPAHDRNKRPPRPCLTVHNNNKNHNSKQQADSTEFSAPVAEPIQCGPVSVTIEDKSKSHHGIPQQHGESSISALTKINKPGPAPSSSTLALINLRPLNPSLSAQQESTLPPQPTAAQQDEPSVKDEPSAALKGAAVQSSFQTPTPFPWESKVQHSATDQSSSASQPQGQHKRKRLDERQDTGTIKSATSLVDNHSSTKSSREHKGGAKITHGGFLTNMLALNPRKKPRYKINGQEINLDFVHSDRVVDTSAILCPTYMPHPSFTGLSTQPLGSNSGPAICPHPSDCNGGTQNNLEKENEEPNTSPQHRSIGDQSINAVELDGHLSETNEDGESDSRHFLHSLRSQYTRLQLYEGEDDIDDIDDSNPDYKERRVKQQVQEGPDEDITDFSDEESKLNRHNRSKKKRHKGKNNGQQRSRSSIRKHHHNKNEEPTNSLQRRKRKSPKDQRKEQTSGASNRHHEKSSQQIESSTAGALPSQGRQEGAGHFVVQKSSKKHHRAAQSQPIRGSCTDHTMDSLKTNTQTSLAHNGTLSLAMARKLLEERDLQIEALATQNQRLKERVKQLINHLQTRSPSDFG